MSVKFTEEYQKGKYTRENKTKKEKPHNFLKQLNLEKTVNGKIRTVWKKVTERAIVVIFYLNIKTKIIWNIFVRSRINSTLLH